MIDYENLAKVVRRCMERAVRGKKIAPEDLLLGETLDLPEEQIRALGEERDAARREAAELRALLMRLSLVGGALIVRHGPPTTQPQAVHAWWGELRALLAPPPERAGEESRG